jgi:hypothetical protein
MEIELYVHTDFLFGFILDPDDEGDILAETSVDVHRTT